MKIKWPGLAFISLLVFSSLACTLFIGGPSLPSEKITASPEGLASLLQKIQSSQAAALENGILTLSITESELSSLLASKLSDQPDSLIQNLQVVLQNNEIQIYGVTTKGNFQANSRVVIAVAMDPDGKPIFKVTSADFGPMPAPEGLTDAISTLIDQAFTGVIGPAITGIRLDSVVISDGILTLTGRVK